MKPTPALFGRLKRRIPFTTKQVGKGFYRGNRTGAMGAHTQYGGYVIDWRKVRHFVAPQNLSEFKLTPFVAEEINPKEEAPLNSLGQPYDPEKMDVIEFLRQWQQESPQEVEQIQEWQDTNLAPRAASEETGMLDEDVSRLERPNSVTMEQLREQKDHIKGPVP